MGRVTGPSASGRSQVPATAWPMGTRRCRVRGQILPRRTLHHHCDLGFYFPIRVAYSYNRSLAWSSNSKRLFAVSSGEIICLDVSPGATLSQWFIHGDGYYNCIAQASDGAFIAASSSSSVSFWDATTHRQIGSAFVHTGKVNCMAISANHDIMIGNGDRITLGSLCNILPSSYCDTVSESGARFAAQ